MFGAAVTSKIWLNDEIVGRSVPGGFFYVDRPAGNYEVRCATEAEHKVTLALAAGETRTIETKPTMGVFVGHIRPYLVEPEKGMEGVRKCSYIGDALEGEDDAADSQS